MEVITKLNDKIIGSQGYRNKIYILKQKRRSHSKFLRSFDSSDNMEYQDLVTTNINT